MNGSNSREHGFPLVIAGPIVRAVTPTSASVWLALTAAADVTLSLFDDADNELMSGEARTLACGRHLHLVLVTAQSDGPVLPNGALIHYDLSFATEEGVVSFDAAVGGLARILYPNQTLPSFCLPPDHLEDTRILYGSCRKPHGIGRDAMPVIDQVIADAVRDGVTRPHQLYLMGDQIYADDVASVVMEVIHDLEARLGIATEALPGIKRLDTRPGQREHICRDAGLTAVHCANHTFTLSEYTLLYLLVFSDVPWPETLPNTKNRPLPLVDRENQRKVNHRPPPKDYLKERALCIDFQQTMPAVRRALANIPSYMMFDDHEVTDDWFLNRGWTTQILSDPLGRRILINGLAAYALVQGWGNNPEVYQHGPHQELIRTSCGVLSGQAGEGGHAVLDRLIGYPSGDMGGLENLDRDPQTTCRWDYRIFGPSFETWVLDTRTLRAFRGPREDSIPDLIGGQGWSMLKPGPRPESKVTLVVAPTNVIDIPFTARLSKLAAKLYSATDSDYGDTWEAQTEAFERLLAELADVGEPKGEGKKRRYVFLSGDVHYSFATRIHYWATRPYRGKPLKGELDAVFAHLTCSPFRNQNIITWLYHAVGHIPRFPKVMAWAGWNVRPHVDITSFRGQLKAFFQRFRTRGIRHTPPLVNLENPPRELLVTPGPDWRYRVDHLRGYRLDKKKMQVRGGDLVGRNNLGELSFSWDDSDPVVTQILWWHHDKTGEAAPRTRYHVSLAWGDGSGYPKPLLPQERASLQ